MLYASWKDVKCNEVPNWIWGVLLPCGFFLTVLEMALTKTLFLLGAFTLIFVAISVFAVAIFYLGAFGGADSKALICLAASFPFVLQEGYFILFPLAVFFNSLVFALPMTLGILVRDIIKKRDWRKSAYPFIPFLTLGFLFTLLYGKLLFFG